MRRHISLLLAAVLALTTLVAATSSRLEARPGGPGLRAGVATVDITPELGKSTLGYVRPEILMNGVHTRLTGRALVLDDGRGQPVVLLATDLGFALRKDDVVARVADLGYSDATVVYHSSHTHSGPERLDDWQVDQLAEAIRTAHENRVPVLGAWGTSRVLDVNRNRSVEAHLANHGMDLFEGQGHPQDDPHGEEHTRDTTVRVLRLDRADGSGPLTAWTHFPVHLTTVTPGNTFWDADLAGTTSWYLQQAVNAANGQHDLHDHVHEDAGFTALYANGAQGDLMPRFDSYNPQALVDLHGRRLAKGALAAWQEAGRSLSSHLEVDVAWSETCFCGTTVDEEGHQVSRDPVWGLPFLGGSEDGASIFMEALGTEGKRRPAELADPVHGRKIVVAPTNATRVHDLEPEFAVIRIGDHLALASPGEPSVEMGRRFVDAVQGVLPPGVTDVFNLGLANGYIAYLTTPEEYDQQHYEGGHTVYGKYTSLFALNEFVALTEALGGHHGPVAGAGAVARDGAPAVGGDRGVVGKLVSEPTGPIERMQTAEVSWTGAEDGRDRPVDTPLVVLERQHRGGAWRVEESDLGSAVVWSQEDDAYTARFDLRPDLPLGRYRIRVTADAYELVTREFEVRRSTGLIPRGVEKLTRADGSTWLRFVAQNPAPDPERNHLWRPLPAGGGTLAFSVNDHDLVARWDGRLRGWVAPYLERRHPCDDVEPGGSCPSIGIAEDDAVVVAPGALVDRLGNTNGEAYRLAFADGFADPVWPDNIGVGGGRTPGPFGRGTFPP